MELKRLRRDPVFRKTALILFALLCINHLGIYVTGGENQYLALAKQFINPDWIPGSFSLSEPPGTRLLFQVIVGPIMQVLAFPVAVFLLRLVNYALLAVPMALIFRHLKLGLLETFVVGQFLIMGPQCFFGGEWIYGSFEPKTVAYVFLFYALYAVLKDNVQRVAINLALATYFHLLVGGWFAIVLLAAFALRKEIQTAIRFTVRYALMVLPLLVYVLVGYFQRSPGDVSVNLDNIYVYYRLPNHLGIFRDLSYFLSEHAIGVVVAILACAFTWARYRHVQGVERRMSLLVLIILCINLAFVIVALIDHVFLDNSGGLLLKSYPFRTSSIAYFMFVLLLYLYLHRRYGARPWSAMAARWIVILFVALTLLFAFFNIRRSFDSFRDPDFDAMARDIRTMTERDDVFLILDLGPSGVMYNSFTRKAERENFSVFKFVPYQQDKLYEWYLRTQALARVNENLDHLAALKRSYRIDYILSRGEVASELVELKHRNDTYYLYEIR